MVGVTRQLYVFSMTEGSLLPDDTFMNLKFVYAYKRWCSVTDVHPALAFRPFVLCPFALTPLANLHHFLICALSFFM
jgi:hypothetical protein